MSCCSNCCCLIAELALAVAQRLFGCLAIPDIAVRRDHDRRTIGIAPQDHSAVDNDFSAVLGAVAELAVPDAVALQDFFDSLDAALAPSLQQLGRSLALRLIAGEAVEPLGAAVPIDDAAVELPLKNRVVGFFQHLGLAPGQLTGAHAIADIEIDADPAGELAGAIAHRHAARKDRMPFAIDAFDAEFAFPDAAGATHSSHEA